MEFLAGVIVGVAALPFFWVIFAVAALLLGIVVVNERGFLSTVLSIAVGVMIFAKLPYELTVGSLAIGVVGYAIIGILWSRFKWSRFLSAKFDRFTEIRDSFLKKRSLTLDVFKKGLQASAAVIVQNDDSAKRGKTTIEKLTPEELEEKQNATAEKLLEQYVHHIKNATTNTEIDVYALNDAKSLSEVTAAITPLAKTNKGSIVMWIAYWPISLVWYLIADIATDIGRWLYNLVGGHFQKMSAQKFEQL